MAKDDRPTMHMIAGPNGAGKSTLYRTEIQPLDTSAEFVNADELAQRHYGHSAQTLEESQTGQRLAEERRRQLMAEGKSLVAESTFSHPSKVDLLREAKAADYRVVLYHVNVSSPDLSVYRVASRVDSGGHPVPEDKIRERYQRNQALIHQASGIADHTHVFDNSRRNELPHRAIELREGRAVWVDESVPKWTRELYAEELAQYAPQRANRAVASFEAAHALTQRSLGETAQTYIARPGGTYSGGVLGQTEEHVVQQVGERFTVAHFESHLSHTPKVGERATIAYSAEGEERATVTIDRTAEHGPHAAAAEAWRKDPVQAAKDYPALADEMNKASVIVETGRKAAADQGLDEQSQSAFVARTIKHAVDELEHGRSLPDLRTREHGRSDGYDEDRER
ncbi:zeta toxin family protein [Arhodomonas sp. AD133]|uniref:zeta toxin family protein n=1 Tax=Arhodomonas sp. AD133 TaxID=3415009 RepID=UPI003EBA6DF4